MHTYWGKKRSKGSKCGRERRGMKGRTCITGATVNHSSRYTRGSKSTRGSTSSNGKTGTWVLRIVTRASILEVVRILR